MGITDELKVSNPTHNKATPATGTTPGVNEDKPTGNVIPQMVITSVEGVAEEIKMENVNGSSGVVETVEEKTVSQEEHSIDDKKSAFQRPLVISASEKAAVPAEEESLDSKNEEKAEEYTSRIAVQRPLIITASEEAAVPAEEEILDSKSEVKTEECSSQPTVRRSLIINASEEAAVPVQEEILDSKSEERTEECSSRITVQRPLIINASEKAAVPAEEESLDSKNEEKAQEYTSRIAVQRPLIITESEEHTIPAVEVCQENEAKLEINESHPRSTEQRPLVIESMESVSKEINSDLKPATSSNEATYFNSSEDEQRTNTVATENIYEIYDNELPAVEKTPTYTESVVDQDPKKNFQNDVSKSGEGSFFKSKMFHWKLDSKNFSFPKINFGSKESKDSTSSSHRNEKKSLKLQKSSTRAQKSECQEYSIEAADASNKSTSMESYRQINNDLPEIQVTPLKNESENIFQNASQNESMAPLALSVSDEIKAAPALCKEDSKLKSTPESKTVRDTKQQVETPESLYDTCCLRLAYLIRNKAIEIVTENTSKPLPPKKPPKPTAEAIAKARAAFIAKRVKEYEARPHNFGDDIPGGYTGLRYADDDTESSTDYKDVEDLQFIADPECYGVIRKLKFDNKMSDFRAPSTCSGMTSYYTAETVTLKDENSSENTLETVSLGSSDSVVHKPPSVSQSNVRISSNVKSSQITTEKLNYTPSSMVETTSLISNTSKKIPPPVPPKPDFKSLERKRTKKEIPAFSKSHHDDISRCVNSLSLSPRSVKRSSSTVSTKNRPLTIAGVKETEFSCLTKNKVASNVQKKPVLDTVLINKSLQSVSKLPKDHENVTRSVSCGSRMNHSTSGTAISKSQPPQRPPPPTMQSKFDNLRISSTDKSSPTSTVTAPPRHPALKRVISPPRPPPPLTKPIKKPVRPPRPHILTSQLPQSSDISTNASSKQNEEATVIYPQPEANQTNIKIGEVVSTTMLESSSTTDARSNFDSTSEKPLIVENKIILSFDSVQENGNFESKIFNNDNQTNAIKNEENTEFQDTLEVLSECLVPENEGFDKFIFDENASHKLENVAEISNADDRKDGLSYVEFEHISHLPVNKLEISSDNKLPVKNGRIPRPPPRVRRKRSRTVEIVPVVGETIKVRRRSQSLSSIEEKIYTKESSLLPESPEFKALYTTVNKNRKNAELSTESVADKISSSTEMIASRPLPPPPLPPRSKSRSSSRRSKSDERPKRTYSPSIASIENNKKTKSYESLRDSPTIKPPVRHRKENKERFLSLGNQTTKDEMKKINFKEFSKSEQEICANIAFDARPVRPERKSKSFHVKIQYDENGNVAESLCSNNSVDKNVKEKLLVGNQDISSRQRIHSLDNVKPPERKKSPSALQRSISEHQRKKSHSSWYDESETVDAKTCDNLNNSEENVWEEVVWEDEEKREFEQSVICPKRRSKSSKKSRQTSTFYVDVENEQDYAEKEITNKEDKETSPLPLECSEKSVQTSLETLSRGLTPHGDRSDDTDELLDLAQTLQDELKTIINRHKVSDKTELEEEDVGSISDSHSLCDKFSPEESSPALFHPRKQKSNSIQSSTSELWQMSSSDDSEEELLQKEEANLSEIASTRKKKKIFYVAQEIMTSEETFVDTLKLLNVDFRAAVENANKLRGTPVIPDEVLNQLLNHLPQLQHLNENLLMDLKERIDNWDSTNKIADVIVKMGPFLKLYSWYIQDFESMSALLEDAKKKYPSFAQVIKEFELSSRCKRLSLNFYMLRPVQRIPQYRLLLQEYLHHLSEDSPDYENTLEALRIVSEVANHANESMKQGDNFQKLMSIQSSILGHKEIIKPGRMFMKEGELMKLSRKGMQPRWFVLLNDLLLYLTPVQPGLYRINHELTLAGMKVAIPIQQDYQNEFSIISVTRSFSLAAKSQEERQEWIIALTKAIEENASKRSTFTAGRLQQKSEHVITTATDDEEFVLGKKAPVWIPDSRVTMCQLCTSEFTVTFRRHHCRACGKVVCSVCSSNRISLQYLGNRIARVCDECFVKLGQVSSGCTESGETDSDNQQIAIKTHMRTDNRHHRKPKRQLPSVLKEVCANDQGSSISGYVQKKVGKNWKRNWFVVKDKVLYEYKASEDVAALRSIPLLGYQIETFTEPLEGVDPSLLFQLSHPGQAPIVFHAETPGSAERWIRALKDATVLE